MKEFTKSRVKQIAKSLGCETKYSGNTETFYIIGLESSKVFSQIIDEFGGSFPYKVEISEY